MPYVMSSSRRHFELQVKEIKKRLRTADKRGVPTDLRDYAIAAAIFLAHAEVENYFVDVLSRLASCYSRYISDASALPTRLRAHLISEKFNLRAVAEKVLSKGESEILDKVESWFRSASAPLLNDSKQLSSFNGTDIHGDYSYPSKKNLLRVLRRIGISDPVGSLSKTAKRDVIGHLESLASLRTALAHSASLPGISCADVANRIDNVQSFTAALDRLIYQHARVTVTDAAWKEIICKAMI